jgi:hypothetical protein
MPEDTRTAALLNHWETAMFARLFLRATCFVTLAMLVPGGCVITVDPTDGVNGDGGDDGGNGAVQHITVRVINTSNTTLDPEIYVSAEPVSISELFRSANKYTRYGVGTQGILADHDSDTFTLDCSEARVLGTKGGKFGDDLNDPDGTGQQIVLTQDLSIFCGGTVTFTYSRTISGYTTTYIVER